MNKHVTAACGLCLALATAAPAQTPAGPEFLINTYTTNRQSIARSAMEPDGDFVAVWESYTQDGNHFGVFGQRLAASGARLGAEFQVNTYTTGPQGLAAVAVGSKGDFVVVWTSGQDGSLGSIHGRRFDAAGSALGSEFQVNTFTPGMQYRPHVGRASDGRFVVSWTSQNADGDLYGIAARRYDASGNAIGSEFVVNTYTTGYQVFGELAVEAGGSFVAVWEDYFTDRDGSGSGIFGQRYDAAGNRLGAEFQVNTYTTGRQALPSVSVSPAGGFVVAWASEFGDGNAYGTFARRFDAAGSPLGSDFVVNTYTLGDQYGLSGQVAHDARGNFVVSWISTGQDGSSYGSFAQRFSASGARRGAEFRVNTYTTGSQIRPASASDAVGNFLVTWDSAGQDGSDNGVFAQRFGGLRPAALAVDGLGNNVLEPGETVNVVPSWQNLNGAPQTFSGTFTNITGPAGATYTITDPAASYGTVANGATASCGADCYAVSVSNPATRPVPHWDAAAVESILPDTQGQQKQWRLHVGRSFTDVPTTNPFYRFVETLLHNGVTGGLQRDASTARPARPRASRWRSSCSSRRRGRTINPPACSTPVFNDVPANSPFCRWIEELARRGVVTGCGGGNYCPTGPVTREQMAVFLLRLRDPNLDPPPCVPPNVFLDVPETSPFCRWIEALVQRQRSRPGAEAAITVRCAQLTREQMGVFLSVTFGLTLYGP